MLPNSVPFGYENCQFGSVKSSLRNARYSNSKQSSTPPLCYMCVCLIWPKIIIGGNVIFVLSNRSRSIVLGKSKTYRGQIYEKVEVVE